MPEEGSIQKPTLPDDAGNPCKSSSTPKPLAKTAESQALKKEVEKEIPQIQSASDMNKEPSIVAEPGKPNPQTLVDVANKSSDGMDVHHHPHLHHPKRWTDYLFEFLMVFLAVILGFLFENLREHYTEHQRAKEYAQSLYNDLKKDAGQITDRLAFKKWRSQKLDSLMTVTNPTVINKYPAQAYYYSCILVIPNLAFRPSDITVQQLRNSGTLRYFSLSLINRITEYYNNCNAYSEIENGFEQLLPPYSLTAKIFDADLLASLFATRFEPDLRNAFRQPGKEQDFKLLPSYPEALNEYRLYVGKQKRGNDGMISLLQQLVEKPRKELIVELQNEFTVH